ncbi:MAG: methyltransferase domain-containing protein [Planctomyces sp.]|nr:methyltransferase domain-containing protein [Planctomyces sp.]
MNFEIVEEPIRLHLHGVSGVAENEQFGETGLRLMNEMWQVVKGAKIANTGINHWVYFPAGRMFVGVELQNPEQVPTPVQLEPLEFELQRYMKHVHVGPYQALPQTWKELKAELAARGEVIAAPSLEIYGHHCDDPSKSETTILIGLQAKPESTTTTIDRTTFESIYAGQPRWEIGRPQKAFIDVADPIRIAKQKAMERGLTVTFQVMDALTLNDWPERFDNVIDSALFHVFSDDDRCRYIEGLATVLKSYGRFYFLCFSDKEPGTQGPRRVSQKEIEVAFAEGWQIESIEPSRYEVRPDPQDISFNDGGPRAWFVVVRRLDR